MKAKRTSPVSTVLLAACLAGSLLAAALCCYQAALWVDARADLARLGEPDAIRSVRGEDIARLADEKAAAARQVAQATRLLADVQARRMPLDAPTVRRQILDMLDLAAACGLTVEEIKPMAGDAQSLALAVGASSEQPAGPAGTRENLAAFLNRFSRGAAPRPLVRLSCRGEFATIRDYFARLQTLRWQVTPALFEIGQAAKVGQAWTEDEAPAAMPAAEDKPLRLSVIVAL